MIRIVQITDPHLSTDPNYRLAGVDTSITFNAVMADIDIEAFDLVLATGDIAANGDTESYNLFFGQLNDARKIGWLPGNHDLMDAAIQAKRTPPFSRHIDLGNWRILFLDSSIPHRPEGELGTEELDVLRQTLELPGPDHLLVCLHHQPVNVGSAWIDNQRIKDHAEFLEIIDVSPQVKGVVWGHVHQDFELMRYGRLFCSTPSTCIQFKAQSDDFAIDSLMPGYRTFELGDSGEISTRVHRVNVMGFNVDTDCLGY